MTTHERSIYILIMCRTACKTKWVPSDQPTSDRTLEQMVELKLRNEMQYIQII